MKNELNYYYGIKANDIHQSGGMYKFEIYGQRYCLLPYHRDINDIEEIYKISVELFSRGIYCHQIIPNVQNEKITYINQSPYVLLQIYINDNQNITSKDIELFTNLAIDISLQDRLRRDDWKKLWTTKIDYFEYQVNQFGKKYPLIRESFSYYCGLVETGISLLNIVPIEYNKLVVSHRRILNDDTLFELYNPLNFIIDIKVRDICEYFKQRFLIDDNVIVEIKEYISNSNFNIYECIMFFIRMLYPSFYFDIYEEIIENEKDEELLIPIINLTRKYENLLKEIYLFFSMYISMPEIEWLKKM